MSSCIIAHVEYDYESQSHDSVVPCVVTCMTLTRTHTLRILVKLQILPDYSHVRQGKEGDKGIVVKIEAMAVYAFFKRKRCPFESLNIPMCGKSTQIGSDVYVP